MDKETQEKFDALPKDIKDAITSGEVLDKVRALAIKHSLHIDQSGIFEREITRVMLGIEHTDDFVENLEDTLGISTEEAIELATEVNIEIFLPIRQSLMTADAGKTSIQPSPKMPESTSKADILAEIENPTPVQPPISSAGAVIPKTPQPQSIAHEFIAGKMSEPVSLPAQKYSADPYREPLA